MLTDLLYLFLTSVITFVCYPFWINFVYKFQMGEEIRSDGPVSHLKKQGTPTMGGLVFLLTVAIVTFAFNRSRNQTLFPIFVSSLAGLFGPIEDFSKVYKRSGLPGFLQYNFPFLFDTHGFETKYFSVLFKPWNVFKEFWRIVGSDDRTGLKTYQKFMIQAFIGGFVSFWVYFKLGWSHLWLPLIGNVNIGFFYPIFIFVLFIAVLNFVAFSDGLDGLVGGLSTIAFCAFWVLAPIFEYHSLATLCATFVGALIPFLYFNINPARIFMGNVGSHVLGAIFVILSIILHREIALLFICAVFLVDGLSSPLQQLSMKFTKKRILRMAPLHHHFEMLGWPEAKVTMRFWLFGCIFALLGILVALL